MPTIQQLPQAVIVNPTDAVMLDQGGTSVSASVSQVLAAQASTITLTGDVTGSGSGTIVTTLAAVAKPGTYDKVTVNAKGLVTAGGQLAAADVVQALGYTPYSAANPANYSSGSSAAITGGTIAGADVSGASVVASGASAARTLAARAAETIDVLDYGADPTGQADSAPAFAAAMAAVPSGSFGCVHVPAGSYRLGTFLNQPSGRSIAFAFAEGANITGSGLGVDRIESKQGAYSQWTGGGGWFGFAPVVGTQPNYAFRSDVVQNTPGNSGASRIGFYRNYTNYNYYGKYNSGIDIAEEAIYSWPHLYDNSSGWGHWEVITGATLDEDSASRGHLVASGEHSEYDVVNNGPEAGWTWRSGLGNPFQGISVDPWGQNGQYGGGILYAFGSVGSYDGNVGGLNWRWPSYPAVFSAGNPAAVAQNSSIVITFDLTAKATCTLSNGGVSAVSVSAGGGAYTSAPGVVFSGGGGVGAAGTAVMLGGSVVGVTMTANGSGYASAPQVGFTGGGVAAPVATTVTLNPDGAHGDLGSVAAAINAAAIPYVQANVSVWGGVVSRLVICGTAPDDLGTLTLGGTALGTLGIGAQSSSTPRDTMVVVLGGAAGCSVGDELTLNGVTVTVGGAGALSDAVAAINAANITGVRADVTASGQLVLTCWMPQNPGGLQIAQPSGFTTLTKLGLNAGQFWPPVPPKGFATAYGELTSPVCRVTDQIAISATDMQGNGYGPVTVTLNGGGGSGWVADVATSIRNALRTAGFGGNGSFTALTQPPQVVQVAARGSGGAQGLILRNTAGGTLTLANAFGTPLQTLGLTPGTYQPGGYSAASQSVFMAAEDSIAPMGRGVFVGGASNATDQTVWPNTPLEARGGFLHGLRTDKANFADNTAVLLGATQAIGFGLGSGALSVSAGGGALQVNGAPLALASAVPSRVSQLANDAGYLTSAPVTSVAGRAGAVTLGTADIAGFATAAAAAAPVQSVAGRAGAVTLGHADLTDWSSATSGFLTSQQWTAGAVASVVNGSIAAGTLTVTGAVSSVAGRAGAVTLGTADIAGFATAAAAAAPVQSVFGRTGAVTLGSADVTGALGYTPVSNAGGTIAGSVVLSGTATATTQPAGDNSTRLATTGYVYQAGSGAVSVAVSGGSVTLSASQYSVPVILAIGALTSNATLIVPNNGVWTVANRTTGGFTLTVKTTAGTGVAVDQGYSAELIADGSNVVLATSDFNGVTLQGTVTNAGVLSGGTLSPAALAVGSAGSMLTVSLPTDQSGYHPVMLTNSGTNTNVPLVLAPGGAGYIATALSDGSATNGNQRGQYAVDLQQQRAAATQVASGSYATLPGGRNNVVSGAYGFATGNGNTVSGQGGVGLGQAANDGGAYGKLVFSSNAFTVGNQFGVTTLFVSSITSATRMTSDGGAASAINSLPIRTNHVIGGTLTISARNVTTGDGAYWSIPVLFKNSAGTVGVTSPGTAAIAPTVSDATLSTATVAIAADNTNKGLSVTITPPASVTVSASAVFLATEM